MKKFWLTVGGIFLFIILVASCSSGSSRSSYRSSSSSSSSSSGGFVGSDGKYHSYVPSFGSDVNNWMKNNW